MPSGKDGRKDRAMTKHNDRANEVYVARENAWGAYTTCMDMYHDSGDEYLHDLAMKLADEYTNLDEELMRLEALDEEEEEE